MIKTKDQIIADIRGHMQRRGGAYNDWFVGVGAKARRCLFEEHGVKERGDCWILRKADSPRTAHDVLDYFVNILATDCTEDASGGSAVAVYAYKKADHTRP